MTVQLSHCLCYWTDWSTQEIDIIRSDVRYYAFRPIGSPAAALITLLHHITHLLTANPYVIVISVDFSKAFDTVQHSNLLHKMAQLDLADEVYNWLVSFFHGHTRSTQYLGVESSVLGTTATIIQGSAIGHPSLSVLQTSKQSVLGIYSSSLQTIRNVM